MTVSVRRRHAGRRARRRAGGARAAGGAAARRHGRRCAGGRPQRVRRLGHGPIRDAVLQVRYVSAAGEVVKAGGPTVKNVSGFDLCRLLVGSRGTLGFLGDVILRTRPRARCEQLVRAATIDPDEVMARLYRPIVGAVGRHDRRGCCSRATSATSRPQAAPLALTEVDGPAAAADRRALVGAARRRCASLTGHVRRRARRRRRAPRRAGRRRGPSTRRSSTSTGG